MPRPADRRAGDVTAPAAPVARRRPRQPSVALAALLAALSAVAWARAVVVERKSLRALPRARRLGRARRARGAVPRRARGRDRRPGAAPRAGVGADDRGDDAADDAIRCSRCSAGIVARRGPTPAALTALVVARLLRRLVRASASSRTARTARCDGRRGRIAALDVTAWVVGAAVLAGAGLFQFSALKYRCLEQCHTPFAFVAARWHGRGAAREALRLGLDHGALLRRLLLGADAADVRRRHGQPGLDAGARGRDGGREEPALGAAPAHAAGPRPDRRWRRASPPLHL